MEKIIITVEDAEYVDEVIEEITEDGEKVSIIGGLQKLIPDSDKHDGHDVLIDGILANRVTFVLLKELTPKKKKIAERYATFADVIPLKS